MDKWILSFTQSLVRFVKKEMKGKARIEVFKLTINPFPSVFNFSYSLQTVHSCSTFTEVR